MTIGGRTAAATVFVDVEGDLTKFREDLKGAADITRQELGGGKLAKHAKVAGTALAGAAAGAAAASVKSFVDFERGMNEVFTLIPDAGADAYGKLTDQTKAFATEFGVLPQEVIPALYSSLSAGVPRDNVFAFLEQSQKLAKGGVTDLETAVDGLSSVVNAYGPDVIDAARVSDLMFTAVKGGKTTVDELASSLFNVVPTAAAAGVGFEEITAGLAAMTAAGTPTSVATTQLRQLLVELTKDGAKAGEFLKEMSGKTFADFQAEGYNLADVLTILGEYAGDAGVNMQDLFGSVEAANAALSLTSSNKFYDELEAAGAAAGATEAAFAQMEQGIGPSLDKLKARFAVVGLELGTTLAPTVETVGLAVAQFAGFLAELPGPVLAAIVGFAGLTGGLLALSGPILRTTQLVKGLFTLLSANPYILLIAATIAIGVLIYKNWDEIKAFLAATWEAISGAAGAAWGWIRDTIGGAATAVGGFINDYIIAPVRWVIDLFTSLPEKAVIAWEGVKAAIQNVAGWIKTKLGEIRDAADRALGPIDEIIGKAAKLGGGLIGGLGKIAGFDDGGIVPGPRGAPRLVLAHGGETILPTHKDPNAGVGGGISVHISGVTITNGMDIEHVARELGRRIDRERRAQGRHQ